MASQLRLLRRLPQFQRSVYFVAHWRAPSLRPLSLHAAASYLVTNGEGSVVCKWSTQNFPVRHINVSSALLVYDPLIEYWLRKTEEIFHRTAYIQVLTSKPSHAYQPRIQKVREIKSAFESLRKQHPGDIVVGVYITGAPASGKTQLAREFGEEYFKDRCEQGVLTTALGLSDHSPILVVEEGWPLSETFSLRTGAKKIVSKIERKVGKQIVICTLNASSESSLWRSYTRLALELGCSMSDLASVTAGEFTERLGVIANDVQKKLQGYANWLLIIDGITSKSM